MFKFVKPASLIRILVLLMPAALAACNTSASATPHLWPRPLLSIP